MVIGFLLLRQRIQLGFLGRYLTVFMQVVYTQIPCVCQATNMSRHSTVAFFEQLKIVCAATSKCCGDDFLGLLVHDQLCFLGVSLLFATIVLPLLFWGRSMGCSVASIRTTSKIVSFGCNAFLPGKRNSPDFIRTF